MKRGSRIYEVCSPYGDVMYRVNSRWDAIRLLGEIKSVWYPVYNGNVIVDYREAKPYIVEVKKEKRKKWKVTKDECIHTI